MKTITTADLPESAESKPEEVVKRPIDWLAIVAAVGLGFLIHIMVTSESVIFPAFIGAIILNFIVARIARRF